MLYTKDDLKKSQAALQRKILVLALIALIPQIPAAILMYTARIEWLTIFLSLLGIFGALFYWGLWCAPTNAYRRFVRDILDGRSHEFSGTLARQAQESVRESVPCRTLYFVDDKDGQERLCYLDVKKDSPLSEGGRYAVTVHGQAIVSLHKAV